MCVCVFDFHVGIDVLIMFSHVVSLAMHHPSSFIVFKTMLKNYGCHETKIAHG